jgi:hypothetical protein
MNSHTAARSVEDRVDLERLVAAGVADGLLALGIGPAGSVGEQLSVMSDEQVADDDPKRAQLGVGGLEQPGADVVAEPEVAARCVGVSGPRLCPALLVLRGGVSELVVETSAGEVDLLASRRLIRRPCRCSWTRAEPGDPPGRGQAPGPASCPTGPGSGGDADGAHPRARSAFRAADAALRTRRAVHIPVSLGH